MSQITVEMKDASFTWRDGNNSDTVKVEISPEKFLLAFQGAQAALPMLEALKPPILIARPTISLKYVLDDSYNRFVWLDFSVVLDKQIIREPIAGRCRSPISIEAISSSIIKKVMDALDKERQVREQSLASIQSIIDSIAALT